MTLVEPHGLGMTLILAIRSNRSSRDSDGEGAPSPLR